MEARWRPVELHLERSRQLRVRWADGHESVYPVAYLRQQCPCATCRHEREARARNPLHVIPTPARMVDQATAVSAELVGHYALRVTWADGHDTGIYDFAALRALCPCAACRGK
ncbi:MAG: gamma-butyrobetaine hydroxylase-like domain-containing protein [Phycisphaerae bacterium]